MSYGSLEQKRNYQRSLGLGVMLSGLGFILLVLSLSFISSLSKPEGDRVIRTITIATLRPPPLIIIEDGSTGSPVVAGRPISTPEDQDVKVQIGEQPYRGEIYGFVPDLNLDNVAGSNDDGWVQVNAVVNQKIRLVETDRLPECFHVVLPEHPDSAKDIEAVVFVSILIDQEGKVREVIAKSSRPGGFAKATIAAVKEWKYRPARSGDENVAVRVAYKIKFSWRKT